MNVYIGGTKDYSAMRGPAPSGFHVPLYTEWIGLRNIMYGLGLTTGDDYRIKLHMPLAGFRNDTNSNIAHQGYGCYYWSSSSYSTSSVYAYYITITSTVGTGGNQRARSLSIRCFKDSFELPTSSWTVINGTLGSAGIFWNQTEGLISITSDGTTGYTIQDKNLGATTVYLDGNTLSEANCGKYYQRGNNYGFAWTGSVTTSSTQVNAQNYGPGNYYSSSTFITGSNDWSSVQNDNLRGGVTGIISPAELKNAYIGEYVEETYTIPSMSNSSGTRKNSFLLISKNGYTIKKVIMETTGNPNPSSNYGTYDLGLQNNSNTFGNGDMYAYVGEIGLNNNAKINYKFSSSPSGVDARVKLSGLNHTGSNLTKFSFDSNNGNANINGTNNEYTISGTEKTIVQQILQSATVYAYISIVRATTTATTVTVIYEPNS